MIQLIHYFILSVVQAATEFLPISSSGHLLFLKGVFHSLDIPIIFDIIIHVGSATAIIFYYRKKIGETLLHSFSEVKNRDFSGTHFIFLSYAALSTIITFVFYIIAKKYIEAKYQSPSVLFFTYLVTTVILFSTFFAKKRPQIDISKRSILLPIVVGLFQGFAIMPGISRSGATISPLLLMGIKRKEAAYYSFFMAIPAIIGALILKIGELGSMAYLRDNPLIIVVSFIFSAVFSYLFLSLLTLVLKKGKFWLFSFYTLLVSIICLFIFNV